MSKLQLLVIFIVNAIVLTSCADTTGLGNNNDYGNCSASDVDSGTSQMNMFAIQYLSEIMKLDCDTITGGPLSTFYLFSFIGLYTQNNSVSHNQTLNFTGLPNNEAIRCVLNLVNTYFENIPEGVIDEFSDNVVSDYCNNFTQAFKDDAEATLIGNAFNYNSNIRNDGMKKANDMIANDTDNYVDNAVLCTDIFKKNCSASKLILLSGEYYLARWRKEFVPAGKKNYTDMDNNTYLVDYVMQCDTYSYKNSDEINAEVIVIDGAKGIFQLEFYIPRAGCNLTDMLEKLANKDIFQQVMGNLEKKKMLVYFPIYSSATTNIDRSNIVKQMGYLSSFFDANTANFIDSNGEKRVEYVSAGSSKVIFESSLEGDEPNDNDECTDDSDVMELVVDRPVVYFVSREDIFTLCGVAKVDTRT